MALAAKGMLWRRRIVHPLETGVTGAAGPSATLQMGRRLRQECVIILLPTMVEMIVKAPLHNRKTVQSMVALVSGVTGAQ